MILLFTNKKKKKNVNLRYKGLPLDFLLLLL